MSEVQTILCETARGLFSPLAESSFADGWPVLAEAAFNTLLIDEDSGGFGGDWSDLFAVLKIAGEHGLPLPVGESILASRLIHQAGLAIPEGALTIATRVSGDLSADSFTGTLKHVPWGRDVDQVVAQIKGQLALLNTSDATITESKNPAGEPRDTLVFNNAPAKTGPCEVDLQALAAFLRVAQASGAMEQAMELTMVYVNERKQFGRPIAKFQAVQQNLAVLAAETSAVNNAGQAAALALDTDLTNDGAAFELAAAKLRTNMAVSTVTSLSHQAHGAIGFTEEYPLQRSTRRLMGWRSEFGNDRYWAESLGGMAAKLGGSGLWEAVTLRSDRID